jgi:type IV secretion system protein VirB8
VAMERMFGAESAYFAQAASWERDRVSDAARATRRAWIVASVAVGLCLLLGASVLTLLPLKEIQPYVIRVDSRSGIVDTVPIYAGAPSAAQLGEPVVRYLLQQYVMTRERFVYALAEADYFQVGALQSPALNRDWAQRWERNNPQSPLNAYKDGTTRQVEVQSISFLPRVRGETDVAQIRYRIITRMSGGAVEDSAAQIATLQYAFGAPPTGARERALNPLGFRVTAWRSEPELPPAPRVASASGVTPAASAANGGLALTPAVAP